ncbi:PQQ-binding-like beta-propeller repeat protein [Stieleria sp. JC731]|uniref:outer membrane protein assembly factor BamB family protein n=1 Tax=Pirellulaceae TaxID=2691357 RepID=UPI001E50AFBA|nr:PQQ-binding-like beta-propeller repeat protein [Stieleria sp. JC731]MCC9601319.1 PQQ-binding-like beta-propeller repeat protein [Stieleria sp. JC731]
MSFRHQLLSLLLATLPLVSLAGAEEWYRWRGPNLDGIADGGSWSGVFPDGGAKVLWRSSVGIGFSSFVTGKGLVITMGHVGDNSVVTAFDQKTGEAAWTFQFAAPLDDRDFEGGPTSTPTIDSDHVYVLSRMGEVFCLDLKSGELIWKVSLPDETGIRLPGWGCSAAPLVIGNKLLINLGEAGIAMQKSDGQLLWKSKDRECGYATPVPIPNSNPAAIVIASGKSYKAVEVESGEELWSIRWLTSFNCNAADPIIKDKKLFLSSGYNRGAGLFSIDTAEPETVWKNKEMKNQIHGSILFKGKLYGIDGDMETGASLRCMDFETGEIDWSEDDLRPGGIAMVGDDLIVLTEDGMLITAPATSEGWSPTSETKALEGKCWTAPVFSDQKIYCRTVHGEVVCIDCRE